MKNVFYRIRMIIYLLIILVASYSIITTSHIFSPLILDNIEEKAVSFSMEDAIIIEEEQTLNPTCYKGSLNKNIENRFFIYGILNYLCEELPVRNVKIATKNIKKINKDNSIVAAAYAKFIFNDMGILFMENSMQSLDFSKAEIAHIVFHEYIHLLMYKNMANNFTINSKSKQLINSVKKSYTGELVNSYVYPSEYSKTSPKEQIAEILGIYLAKKTVFDYKKGTHITVMTSNFEQDLYKQFLNNIK